MRLIATIEREDEDGVLDCGMPVEFPDMREPGLIQS